MGQQGRSRWAHRRRDKAEAIVTIGGASARDGFIKQCNDVVYVVRQVAMVPRRPIDEALTGIAGKRALVLRIATERDLVQHARKPGR